MIGTRPALSAPGWWFRAYQAALVVIVLIYALILVVLIPSGLLSQTGAAISLLGSIFLLYLAPGTALLLLAVFLVRAGKRPGPVIVGIALLAAIWTIIAGYNLVLT